MLQKEQEENNRPYSTNSMTNGEKDWMSKRSKLSPLNKRTIGLTVQIAWQMGKKIECQNVVSYIPLTSEQ